MQDLNQIYSQYMIDRTVRERATEITREAPGPDSEIMEQSQGRLESIPRIIQLLRSVVRRPASVYGPIRVNDGRQPG
jgi:hypothetical protein